MARRAPRAVRRGRKFKARPTSHDGLTVIAAAGNRAGWTSSGTVAGRVGHCWIECADGYRVSVIAGEGARCLPWVGVDADVDYRGPYEAFEILTWDQQGQGSFVPLWAVRALLDGHGGFRRMHRVPGVVPEARRRAARRALANAERWVF